MRLGLVGIIAVAFLALEIVGMALVAGEIGGLRTVLWLLGAALAGGWLIRTAGAGFLPELMQASAGGQDPFGVLWRAGRRFLAGLLLIIPGPITDGLALLLLLSAGLPRPAAPASPPGPRPDPGHGPQRHPGRQGPVDDAIEGEYRRED